MNWATCREPLPVACLDFNQIIQDHESKRITELFPPNTFNLAYFCPLDVDQTNKTEEQETPDDPPRLLCKVLVTYLPGEDDRYLISIFRDVSDASSQDNVHVVFTLEHDYFVTPQHIVFNKDMGSPVDFTLELADPEQIEADRVQRRDDEEPSAEGEEEQEQEAE